MYVDPKVDDKELKGWCLDIQKSRMMLVVKMSVSKKKIYFPWFPTN